MAQIAKTGNFAGSNMSHPKLNLMYRWICTLKLSNSTISYFFSASFRTYLEDARDQIAPISTRGDQLKQVKALELSETDFREAGQGLQERMTG